MTSPKVTVLMPVYNGEKYLINAIDSILNQDYTDFEFLIINDGSTDGSQEIIDSYTDPRIRQLNNEKNFGLVNTLNKGMESAMGKYIARMDCDDISHINRLSVQVKFMDDHPKVGACGSYYSMIQNSKEALVDFPLTSSEMKSFMVFNSPIAHPTVIFRKSLVEKNKLRYRSEYIHAEDYDLWSQLSEISDLANVSEVLLDYRVHENQITSNEQFVTRKNESLNIIRLRHLAQLDILPTKDEITIHHLVSDGRRATREHEIIQAEFWLRKIQVANQNKNVFAAQYFEKIILERWLRLCFNFYGLRKGFQHFIKSELYSQIKLPIKQKLEFFKNMYYSFRRKMNKK